MTEEKVYFSSPDGIKLCAVWTYPKAKTNRAIILAHGIMGDKDEEGIFTKLAKRLSEVGFAVLRFDFRGHGESEGRSVNMTIAGELLDLEAAISEAGKKGYSTIGLVGASFGGGVAILYSAKQQHKVQCLCLWNPCLDYDHIFLNPFLPWLREHTARMNKDMRQKGWTTLGSDDFVVGKPLFAEMAKLYPAKEVKRLTIPILIVHGDKDSYVPYEDSQEAVRGVKNAKLVTIKGSEHGFQESKIATHQAITETVLFFQKYLSS